MSATTPYIKTHSRPHVSQSGSPLLAVFRKLNDTLLLDEATREGSRRIRRAMEELRVAGFSRFQLDRTESQHIGNYLRPGEHIHAGVRGHIFGLGGILILATDTRMIYLHEDPHFSDFEEFSYDVVTGISVNRARYLSSVALFTKFKTYQIDYINPRQADRFLAYVESRIYHTSPLAKNQGAVPMS